MLDFVRRHQRLMLFVLLLLIFPPFVLFGLEGYTQLMRNDDVAAKVGSQKILIPALELQLKNERQRFAQQLKGQADPQLLEQIVTPERVLSKMVQDQVLAQMVQEMRLLASDELLAQSIARIFPNEQGGFDKNRYLLTLAAQNITPSEFEKRIRDQLALEQLSSIFSLPTTTANPFVSEQLAKFLAQKREIAYLVLPQQAYINKIKVSDEEIAAYWKANQASFTKPETVTVEYLVFSRDFLTRTLKIDEMDVKKYYEQNQARYAQAEQRRARHILIQGKDLAAQKKTQDLYQQLQKNRAAFASLAKQYSADPSSATKGGDLGTFARGAMVKPFDDAVFAANQGDLIAPIKTDFGWHIIELSAIDAAKTKPFNEVKASIEQQLKSEQLAKRYASASEELGNLVYENPDTLQPAAQKYDLPILTATGINRSPNPNNTAIPAIFNKSQVLNALFSDEVLNKRRNTALIDLGEQQIAARITVHQAATVRPLSEVTDVIRTRLTQQAALKLTEQEATAQQLAWREGKQPVALKTALVSRATQDKILPTAVVQGVFGMILAKDNTSKPFIVPANDMQYLVRVRGIQEAETVDVAQQKEQVRKELAQTMRQTEVSAFLAYWQNRIGVKLMTTKSNLSSPATKS